MAPAAFAAGDVSYSRAIPTAAPTATPAQPVRSAIRATVSDTPTDTTSRHVTRNITIAPTTTQSSRASALANTVNHNGQSTRVSASSLNNTGAVRRAGLTLRPTVAEVGGRAIISGTNTQTGSNVPDAVRTVKSRAATQTRETIKDAQERLEQTAELNKSCQEQYNECMDQFCAVVDANQKRCSCSANLGKYTKIEQAVKDANNQLNDVAQRIRYVGLSADEIRAIMNATEAEQALSGQTDTTETRNMLNDIEKLIKDPASVSSTYSDTYTSTLDLDLDFSADPADIFNLDFLNFDNTSSGFSKLRGTELYNAAKRRCNTILSQCKDAGATQQQITGNYDLAIDKDCIAYEQGLGKMNDTLKSNVRSAGLMLQKARLAVLQNKNQYDAKACVGALESCMTDEMVCGENYSKCLDPTKRYIDENGKVVLGTDITDITAFMENYNNAEINAATLQSAYGVASLTKETCTSEGNNDGRCIIKHLLTKIGTRQKVTDEGLCRAVLDKCQMYTYDANGNYKPFNDIVVNYVQRAMVNIYAGQQRAISDYAATCMADISTCYNTQVSQVNAWSSSASISSILNVMRGACRNVALTCAYAVFGTKSDVCYNSTDNTFTSADGGSCNGGTLITGGRNDLCNPANPNQCIESISNLFYQGLLCPDNSTYTTTPYAQASNATNINGAKTETDTRNAYVNSNCVCNNGYSIWNGTCVADCGANAGLNNYGVCTTCAEGTKKWNNLCLATCSEGDEHNNLTGKCETHEVSNANDTD